MKKRTGSRIAAVCMALVLGIAALSPVASAAKKYKGVAKSNVNIRTGPSSKAEKAGTLSKGEECVLVAIVRSGRTVGDYTADMDFYKLSTGNYVAAKYVDWTDEINDGTDTDSTDTDSTDDTTDIDDDSSDDSSTDDTSTDDSSDGSDSEDGLEVVDEGDGSSDDTSSDSLDAEVPTETTTTQITGTVTADALNVRSKPASSGTVIKKLKKGEKVVVSSSIKDGESYSGSKVSGNWYKLNTGGFVAAGYLKVNESTVTTGGSSSGSTTTTVATGTATANTTMYASPSTSSEKKGTLSKGKSEVIKSSHAKGSKVGDTTLTANWYRLDNGYYVQANTIKVTKSGATAKVGDTITAKSNVNVRKSASKSSSKVGLLSAGKSDVVTEVSNGWVKLEKAGGFVSADYVTVSSSASSSSSSSSSSDDTSSESQDELDEDIPVDDE